MALILVELYDALRDAGASEDHARKAAEAVAAFDNRLAAIERKLDVLTWMAGTHIAFTLLTLGLLWQLVRALPK